MNRAAFSDEIATFVRVVERGGFAAAAEGTGLTASGVSRTVTRLEDRLGVRLLQRSTRRLTLTSEGETMLARGREILAAIEAAEAEVTAARGKPRGLLRVNTSTAFARHRLVPRLAGFHARYPDVVVELSVNDRRVDALAEQFDLVIRTGPVGDSSLVARKLEEGSRVICASPVYLARRGTPETPGDLARHDCLLLQGITRLSEWRFRENGRVFERSITPIMSCDTAEILLDMALAGLGIVRLASFMVQDALRARRLVPLLQDQHLPEPVPVTALMPPGRQHLPRVRAFLDFLAARADGAGDGREATPERVPPG
jgi:DNA-binding transcriptional LysR family regulator